MDVLAVGETMVVVTPEAGGRLASGSRYLLRPGGAESNVAALLARLGHKAAWASALGADPLGDLVLDDLGRHGVDVSLVRRDGQRPTAVYFKDPTPAGTRVYYYRGGSAASAISLADIAHWSAQPARLVHVSGITAALSEQTREATRALVRGSGLVSFDVNHRPQLWHGDAPEVLLDLAQDSDIVFVGRDEAEALWGTTDAESVRALLDRPRYLVVKDAAIEAVSFTPTGVHRVPSAEVDVVDVVGAGDAFAAGWLSGFLDDRDETTRLRLGHYAAARVLESPSDFADLPPATEIVAGL
ncbi:sugar kinase [Amycolatopsis viridis]|uniref:2-dehydro-3-deoxygluconokinase n=1 Tax=Amycolatopsis viridis TaxID=185678 RepID=A0ABX0SSJ6_9PSEU|nr:sugar kinase [Amycolatopsis viridis]NIH78877.1 2-dehydro-3-deoxygluconokinase [Amycolatopsis viridis]